MIRKRNKRNAILALKCFLGQTAAEVATEQSISSATVHHARQIYADDRDEMLRMYYTNNSDPEIVGEKFGVEIENAHHDSNEFHSRLESLEKKMEVLQTNLNSILRHTPQEPTIDARQAVEQITLGSQTTPEPTSKHHLGDSIQRGDYRIHVTGQAIQQWRELFGADSHGPTADDIAIRRRVIGVFFNGNLTGNGTVYEVTGVNRYAMEGVRLKMTLQQDVIYITVVEKLELTDI